MTRETILYKESVITYYLTGSGKMPVICFHGYGEDGSSFAFLGKEHKLGPFLFISIDLPFHGHTLWKQGLNMENRALETIVLDILNKNCPGQERFCLMGYSLGGRMALSLYQALASRVERVVLLAPDGLKVNFWYWLATRSYIGNRLFLLTMKKPGWFTGLLKVLNKTGWVNASIYKFIHHFIDDPLVREALYKRWTTLRKISPRIGLIKKMIREYRTPFVLIYGQYDRIILSVRGEKFRQGIEPYCKTQVIRAGHQVLHEKHLEDILPALLH